MKTKRGLLSGIITIASGIIIFLIVIGVGVDASIEAVTSKEALTLIVGSAGVAVSVITYVFQRKQVKLRGLIEVFKDLNLPNHREARRVTYGESSNTSYDLLGISPPNAELGTTGELHRVSSDIVRSDMNNAATLIEHGLMDGTIFVEEYWWIILRSWDNSRDRIINRRNSGTGASGYMHNLELLKSKAEKYARKHHKKDYEEYVKKYRYNTV